MKTIIALFALLLIVVVAIIASQNYFKNIPLPFAKTSTLTVNNHTFKLLVSKTDKEKEVGLSGKASLPQDTGMLFIFEKADFYSFWMKSMKFPIDIIYINGNRVVTVHQNVPVPASPEQSLPIYKPEEAADKVFEINAGLSEKYNIKKGDTVKIENL